MVYKTDFEAIRVRAFTASSRKQSNKFAKRDGYFTQKIKMEAEEKKKKDKNEDIIIDSPITKENN